MKMARSPSATMRTWLKKRPTTKTVTRPQTQHGVDKKGPTILSADDAGHVDEDPSISVSNDEDVTPPSSAIQEWRAVTFRKSQEWSTTKSQE
jgi:hypothetical protein